MTNHTYEQVRDEGLTALGEGDVQAAVSLFKAAMAFPRTAASSCEACGRPLKAMTVQCGCGTKHSKMCEGCMQRQGKMCEACGQPIKITASEIEDE